MPSPDRIVINTGPLIALVAGLGGLGILKELHREGVVPLEVADEIETFAPAALFSRNSSARRGSPGWPVPLVLPPWVGSVLDRGEAAVIQLALETGISTVCIDEAAGRRVAHPSRLRVTGSVGILLRAKRESRLHSLRPALEKMRANGVWLGEKVMASTLAQAGE